MHAASLRRVRVMRMETVELVLGYLTGLRFVAPPSFDLASLLATALVVNTCDAFICRLIARNNGYPPGLWTLLGFVFGLWAIAVLIVLPKRHTTGAAPSHTVSRG